MVVVLIFFPPSFSDIFREQQSRDHCVRVRGGQIFATGLIYDRIFSCSVAVGEDDRYILGPWWSPSICSLGYGFSPSLRKGKTTLWDMKAMVEVFRYNEYMWSESISCNVCPAISQGVTIAPDILYFVYRLHRIYLQSLVMLVYYFVNPVRLE